MQNLKEAKIGIIGLGYVGLPLACLFSRKYKVKGFDLNKKRVQEIKDGIDTTGDICDSKLNEAIRNGFEVSISPDILKDCKVFIVAVPTPVDDENNPILSPLHRASITVGKNLKKGDVVIYESTVYPGLTEEVCVPLLEKTSNLKFNKDFFVGYSPERINPGDAERPIEKILKITSGSTPEAAKFIDELYSSVLECGTHMASSIKVAEAAKVVENAQRDINIAFVNQLAILFASLGIDTKSVLEAAGTKWNFHRYNPGLVGGHCIGVDPYYLIHKGDQVGVNLSLVKDARKVNDNMGKYVADRVILHLIPHFKNKPFSPKVLLLGFTFKENCRDMRNTKVVDIIRSLQLKGASVTVYDPIADVEEAHEEYKVDICTDWDGILMLSPWDAIVYCVDHKDFSNIDFKPLMDKDTVVFDVKGAVKNTSLVTERL